MTFPLDSSIEAAVTPLEIGGLIPAYQTVHRLGEDVTTLQEAAQKSSDSARQLLIDKFGIPGFDTTEGLVALGRTERTRLRKASETFFLQSYLAEQALTERDLAITTLSKHITSVFQDRLVTVEAVGIESPVNVLLAAARGPKSAGQTTSAKGFIYESNPKSSLLTLEAVEDDEHEGTPVDFYIARILGPNAEALVNLSDTGIRRSTR